MRLRPGEDLKGALASFARARDIGAASVVAGIGSLRSVNLRLAGALPPGGNSDDSSNELLTDVSHYEIISLSGTISKERLHIHVSLSNAKGEVLGGHLMDLCVIDTTAEITLIVYEDLKFSGEYDSETGFKELSMSSSGKTGGSSVSASKNLIYALRKLAALSSSSRKKRRRSWKK